MVREQQGNSKTLAVHFCHHEEVFSPTRDLILNFLTRCARLGRASLHVLHRQGRCRQDDGLVGLRAASGRAARNKQRLLLLSTDPAHSLADVLQVKLADRVKRLPTTGQLWARQIDPDRQIQKFLTHEREDILALLNKGSLFTRDELAPLLDTSLPGMAEVAALLAIHELLDSDYDEVVIDTAPMGHAIRLFQMPEHFARFLDVLEAAASRDVVLAQHFGGHVQREPALDRWARMVERVEKALSADGSKLALVTTPEPFSLNEAARSAAGFESNAGTESHRGDRAESCGARQDKLPALSTASEAERCGTTVLAPAFLASEGLHSGRPRLPDPWRRRVARLGRTHLRSEKTRALGDHQASEERGTSTHARILAAA